MPIFRRVAERADGAGHASGEELPELFDSVRAHLEQAYRAIRIQTGVPGLVEE